MMDLEIDYHLIILVCVKRHLVKRKEHRTSGRIAWTRYHFLVIYPRADGYNMSRILLTIRKSHYRITPTLPPYFETPSVYKPPRLITFQQVAATGQFEVDCGAQPGTSINPPMRTALR